jgi:hypothetical protein
LASGIAFGPYWDRRRAASALVSPDVMGLVTVSLHEENSHNEKMFESMHLYLYQMDVKKNAPGKPGALS